MRPIPIASVNSKDRHSLTLLHAQLCSKHTHAREHKNTNTNTNTLSNQDGGRGVTKICDYYRFHPKVYGRQRCHFEFETLLVIKSKNDVFWGLGQNTTLKIVG